MTDELKPAEPLNSTSSEIEALKAIVNALKPYESEHRHRIISSALTLLGEPPSKHIDVKPIDKEKPNPEVQPIKSVEGVIDIRTLKEQKKPKSAIEMTAILAY